MSEHTPGPWEYGRTQDGVRMILGGPKRRYVCTVRIHQTPRAMGIIDEPEREANARLIAAAPDLLAVCDAFAVVLRAWGPERRGATLEVLHEAVEAAIAKAEGRGA